MNEAPEDGRVEDGVFCDCKVCETSVYMYATDRDVCTRCAELGWGYANAYMIRRGDTIRLYGKTVEVAGETSLGKGVMLWDAEREYPLRNLTPVLVKAAT